MNVYVIRSDTIFSVSTRKCRKIQQSASSSEFATEVIFLRTPPPSQSQGRVGFGVEYVEFQKNVKKHESRPGKLFEHRACIPLIPAAPILRHFLFFPCKNPVFRLEQTTLVTAIIKRPKEMTAKL